MTIFKDSICLVWNTHILRVQLDEIDNYKLSCHKPLYQDTEYFHHAGKLPHDHFQSVSTSYNNHCSDFYHHRWVGIFFNLNFMLIEWCSVSYVVWGSIFCTPVFVFSFLIPCSITSHEYTIFCLWFCSWIPIFYKCHTTTVITSNSLEGWVGSAGQ